MLFQESVPTPNKCVTVSFLKIKVDFFKRVKNRGIDKKNARLRNDYVFFFERQSGKAEIAVKKIEKRG